MLTLDPHRRLSIALAALAVTLVVGTLGLALAEGWHVFDALYATVLIIATLGFGAHQPATAAGKILTLVLIAGGVGTLFSFLIALAESSMDAFAGRRRERRVKQMLAELRDHVIVCGYGRVGQEVVREVERHGTPLVVIEPSDEHTADLIAREIPVLHGDASHDDVLRAAGIERARGVVVCTSSDAINVFVTLSARSLNDRVQIVARAIHQDDEHKLLRAGANRAITPASLGGLRLANLLLRPTVIDFMEFLVQSGDESLWLEEIEVEADSELVGMRLADLHPGGDGSVTILALKRRGGTLVPTPRPSEALAAGDVLVALGSRDDLARLETRSS